MKAHVFKRMRGKSARWYVIVELAAEGEPRRQRWFPSDAHTKAEAENDMRRLLDELDAGRLRLRGESVIVSKLLDDWLADCAERTVQPSTMRGYRHIVKNHLKPRLGTIRLDRLSPQDIDNAYREALGKSGRKDRRKDGKARVGAGKTLSPTTVLSHHRVLHRALVWGQRRGYIDSNPADLVTPPRVARHDPVILSVEQLGKLLEGVRGTELEAPILLAVTTGCRLGEALALRWSDIDREAGIVRITHSVMELKGRGRVLKETKSRAGMRAVLLPPLFRADFERIFQATQGEWVCQSTDGRPLRSDKVSKGFRAALAEADLPPARFHDLRHSHATLLALSGESPRVVQERLGHSSVSVTLGLYTSVLSSMQAGAAAKLDAAFAEARAKALEESGQDNESLTTG